MPFADLAFELRLVFYTGPIPATRHPPCQDEFRQFNRTEDVRWFLHLFIICNVVCFLSSTATEVAWLPERRNW